MGEFPGSRDRFVDEDRVWVDQNDQKSVVLHGTGGSADQTADQLGDYFETTPLKTSVHYGIDRLGNCDQYVLEKDGCGGEGILDPGHDPFWDQYAPNPNWHSIGIETENDSTNSLPLTDPQKATLFRLVAYLVKKYNIPLSNIKGHFTLEPIERKNCPGPNFDWDGLFNYLKGNTNTMSNVPQGWTDDPTNKILKAPNGIPVTLGFREWIMNHPSWNADDWPLSPEYAANPVEQSNPSIGAGTAQEFRLGTRLGYTAKMGVYQTWTGQELQWYQKQYAALQAQIAALQKQPSVANLTQINTLASQIEKLSIVQ